MEVYKCCDYYYYVRSEGNWIKTTFHAEAENQVLTITVHSTMGRWMLLSLHRPVFLTKTPNSCKASADDIAYIFWKL